MVRRKKFVCKLGLLHHPMTLADSRKTESGTRLLRKLQLPAMWETFHGRTTAKASAYNVPGKPGGVHSVFTLALFHLEQMHSAAFQCRASLCPTSVI